MEVDQLVDKYGQVLYAFCCRLSGNRADAEDLFQDIFLKAVERAHKIDADRNPKNVLFSIAVFAWKERKRKYARRQRLAPMVPEDEAHTVGDGTDLEADILIRERDEALRLAVAGLPEKYQLPLYLHYTAMMPIEDIAKILRVPAGTVKSRMYKARTMIKELLEDTHDA